MKKSFNALRKYALGFPETREDTPWGESAIKVKGKVFIFMRCEDGELSLSVKLPQSHPYALDKSFAEPTGYGLGASGWVTATFKGKAKPPIDLLEGWIEESFRAVAPKKLVAAMAEKRPVSAAKSPSRR